MREERYGPEPAHAGDLKQQSTGLATDLQGPLP
jgi:hypothetical protein